MGNVASEYKDVCRPFMRRSCQLIVQNCVNNPEVSVTAEEYALPVLKRQNFFEFGLALMSIILIVTLITLRKACTSRYRSNLLVATVISLVLECLGLLMN